MSDMTREEALAIADKAAREIGVKWLSETLAEAIVDALLARISEPPQTENPVLCPSVKPEKADAGAAPTIAKGVVYDGKKYVPFTNKGEK